MSNCSLLDEATAGAETAFLLFNERSKAKVKLGARKLFVDKDVFASTRDVILTRCIPQGIEVVLGKWNEFDFADEFFGAIVQYPGSLGGVNDYSEFVTKAHDADIKVGVAADLLGLVLLTPPGEWGLTSSSAQLSASVCPCTSVVPLLDTSLVVWSTSVRYQGVSSV